MLREKGLKHHSDHLKEKRPKHHSDHLKEKRPKHHCDHVKEKRLNITATMLSKGGKGTMTVGRKG
jgi:hypothetical protein